MSDTRYDPFEDTGDWPFRESTPPPEPVEKLVGDPLLSAFGETPTAEPDDDEPAARSAPEDALPEDALPEDAVPEDAVPEGPATRPFEAASEPVATEAEPAALPLSEVDVEPEPLEVEPPDAAERADEPAELEEGPVSVEHAAGAFVVPPGPEVLEGGPHGFRRNVAVVVSRFNGDITSRMLDATLAELRDRHVGDDALTVVPVPGAFELPLAALALAKTRRFSCIVALGCIIRGETAHFDLVASEAASGLQLAGIESGIPVSFGVITCETREQAEERIDRAAEAARTALEMADLFSHVRTRAAMQ